MYFASLTEITDCRTSDCLFKNCFGTSDCSKQFLNQVMAAKRQIMARSELKKMNSQQLVQSF